MTREAAPGKDEAVYILDGDGSSPRMVLEGATNPSWSPDGRQLAAWVIGTRREEDVSGVPPHTLYLMNDDGAAPRAIAEDGVDQDYPASWSPDSRWMAYVRMLDGSHNAIEAVEVRTGRRIGIVGPDESGSPGLPVWSPTP
jgi:Tol biopolymer transport system component